jgi:spore maturation protein CgeB
MHGADLSRRSGDNGSKNFSTGRGTMKILLNYRRPQERLEEALSQQGHSVIYNIWNMEEILAKKVDAVIFETKQILKREREFFSLSWRLRKIRLPRVSWCLDLPNIGASSWKMTILRKVPLLDLFASHSLQGLSPSCMKILYLPNAAWISRYNLGNRTLDQLRDPAAYDIDVSFLGNIDAVQYPEHRERKEFLSLLGGRLKKWKIRYGFYDSRFYDFATQVAVIQKSKINLNIGCGADRKGERSWGLPERCYGIPACGGFLLSDERRHARDDFIEGEEIITFRNLEDCLRKIQYYLSAFEKTREIAEKAYHKVQERHTYGKRAETLIREIQKWKDSQ